MSRLDDSWDWVNVEMVGGPRDGEIFMLTYPPPENYRIPLPQPVEFAEVSPLDFSFRTGTYRAAKDQDFEVVAVTNRVSHMLASIMHGKRPMRWNWEGEDA